MKLGQIAIGDIVSLKSHPYILNVNDILISGEPLQLPPLMIVIEIFESKKSGGETNGVEYTCMWFSSKTNKFERSKIKDALIKLILKVEPLKAQSLNVGDLVSLTTIEYELSKKKSSLHFEDTSVNQGNGSSSINALLSFLPPTLHCIGIKELKEQPSDSKKNRTNPLHQRSQCQVKCLWFNNNLERFSEEEIPLEALKMIPIIEEETISIIRNSIKHNKILKLTKKHKTSIIKPRSITARSGYYFLRGYNYLSNQITEIQLGSEDCIEVSDSAFVKEAPKFDITNNPKAGSSAYILDELVIGVREAKIQKAYIRIKYKNRNDQISYRTLKNYEIIQAIEEENLPFYITGFCLLRQSTRTFKVSRIQNFQQLDIHFS